MNNKHTCLAADDFTEAAWGRLEVGFQNWKAASFMAEIPALQVIPPSCWGNQFAKWKPGSLFPPLTNNWTSFPFSCLVMGAEEGGEGLKLQWINKLVCYWREWRGEVYSTWKCRTCRNCVANSRMSGQLRITCEAFCCHGFAGTVKGGLRRCYSIFHLETKCWRQYLPQPLSFIRSCTAALDGFESFSLSFACQATHKASEI